MVKARKWALLTHFDGSPKRSDFEIQEEELPPLKDGEFLAEAVHLSVDPYMKLMSGQLSPGDTMMGEQVAKITESKNKDFAVGDVITGMFGWRTHTVSSPDIQPHSVRKVNTEFSQPTSTAIGVLGMTGATAYFGVVDLLSPKEGETIVVSGAAGAVGSIVGQLAKLKGCRVVGFAGSDSKVAYLKDLGFDAAYNYKTVKSLTEALKEGCPKGVDMYFDNVGGDMTDAVMEEMNARSRLVICGGISGYNKQAGTDTGPRPWINILKRQMRVEGLVVYSYFPRWTEAFTQLDAWIKEGKLKYKETVTEGFDKMFEAFIGLFKGDNTGKAIVTV